MHLASVTFSPVSAIMHDGSATDVMRDWIVVSLVWILLISAEFKSILAFRQQHRLTNYYDLSDLYFICRLKPLSFDIHPCQDEILKCRWMNLEELAVSKEATPLSHRAALLLMEGRKRGCETIDITMEEWPLHFPAYALTKSYKLFLRTRSWIPT